MRKILLICILLAGCTPPPQVLIKTVEKVVEPPAEMYQCNMTTDFPDPSTLTDLQVAGVLNGMYHDNQQCFYSIDAIKQFIAKAKGDIEQSK